MHIFKLVLGRTALSDPFKIFNGTMPECPLSPLLHIIPLKPFLNYLYRNPDIKVIVVKDKEYKRAAYILLCLTEPLTSNPNLMKAVDLFQSLSKLKNHLL